MVLGGVWSPPGYPEACSMPLTIAVFSDVICPWCYVGKRRLERALDQLEIRSTTSVQWLPFELNPDLPEPGIERAVYRARKFGAERSAQLDQQMRALGEEEGISFAFDRMLRTPNTRRAHMLIAQATQDGRGDQLADSLFRAYFEDARDIGDADILMEIAAASGIEREIARRAMESDELRQHVVSLEQRASELRIFGVPFFIIDEEWAVSGAQATEQWVLALREKLRLGAEIEQPALMS
jgi:predicted DsbA family dithiol-disulfide isomerase